MTPYSFIGDIKASEDYFATTFGEFYIKHRSTLSLRNIRNLLSNES